MNPANIYLFKINKNTRKKRSGAFVVNFEHILHFFLRFLLLTLNIYVYMNTFLLTITYTKLTIETQVQGVKYTQRQQ